MSQKRIWSSFITVLFALAGVLSACDSGDHSEDKLVDGINFTQLFAEPTSAEVNAVEMGWQLRDVSARNYRADTVSTVAVGQFTAELRIVSHTVAGKRHYGALVIPSGKAPRSLPVLVVAHGGDTGVDLEASLTSIGSALGPAGDQFVFVIPSFRSETLYAGGVTYQSEGQPSPWDGDVDDALALLNVTLDQVPQADPERMGVVGFSRGAGVALLMAVRDPRIDVVIDFFGPTDFFDPWIQLTLEEMLQGNQSFLPGAGALLQEIALPLKNGAISMPEARAELIERSPRFFVHRLPAVQLHHGEKDYIVPVSQARALISAFQKSGRQTPVFDYYLYPELGHSPSPESLVRAGLFLGTQLTPSLSASRR